MIFFSHVAHKSTSVTAHSNSCYSTEDKYVHLSLCVVNIIFKNIINISLCTIQGVWILVLNGLK